MRRQRVRAELDLEPFHLPGPRLRFFALLLLLALAVRVPMLCIYHDAYLTGGITTSLGLVARNLLEGRGLTETTGPAEILLLYDRQAQEGRLRDIEEFPDPADQPTAPLIQRMPGYPALLALSWRITKSYRYLPLQIIQVLLSSLLPALLYDAGRRFFGEGPGRIAGILACLNLAEARLAVVPLYDGWMVFLAGVVLWGLARSMERGFPTASFAFLGLWIAAGIYLKSTLLVLPFCLSLFLLPRLGILPMLPRGLLLVGLPLLALIPWTLRNERIFHRPIVTNTFFWPSVWEGFGEVPNPFGAVLDDRGTFLQATDSRPGLTYGSPEYDDYFRVKVLEVWRSHPRFVIALWARRIARGLLFPGNPWGIAGVDREEKSYARFHRETGGGPLSYVGQRPAVALIKLLQRLWDPLLFLLALAGVLANRSRFKDILPLLAFPAAFFIVTVPVHLEGRYVLPSSAVFLLFASVPVSAWILRGGPAARVFGGR
ncbi:MAG TPA: glycosyltransferase family 39 protein [Candidatus Polarisedimenticolia bacterium]|nr:glycosyltransferase family 39 protein [Candidatus Polarisedimenticolia bacterium]